MSEQIVPQDEQKVKLLEDLVNRADKMLAVLLADEDEDSPIGRAVARWLLDAEAAIKPSTASLRGCCGCGDPFGPDDETQVLCPGCEALGIRCGCVMPWQSCAVCGAVEALSHGKPVLDGAWHRYSVEEVCR